jgi:hypothetical protein
LRHLEHAVVIASDVNPAEEKTEGGHRLFISHSSKDAALAQSICEGLEHRGIRCWIAPRNLRVGETWASGCLRGIEESDAFLLLASTKALESVQVKGEVSLAHSLRKDIYTILFPPATLSGEMHFYLARWHWLRSNGKTAEELVEILAASIKDARVWHKSALAPSMWRTFRWGPAYLRLLTAILLGGALLISSAVLVVNHLLDRDFRRLGFIDVEQSVEDGPTMRADLQAWVLAKGVAFRDVSLVAATDTGEPPVVGLWTTPEQVGSMQPATISFDARARRLTTCLTVPSPGLGARYRVTQSFVLKPDGKSVRVAESAEKRVSKEDGSPCGVAQ